ncbi:DUF1146 family protein [Paenibacillus sp. P96]|uniref:DUF1146 family protein n=1 Tax=Paenibacillus zeirhizosphaerae TaxID=2987519 RepID=A0ABT9FNX0_9BACL|nr:DUF1146 family protein [Paenibacillus sp. P96]MDP4096087.1 DUF1146 family protein [Paenibacillus sp. P96]
MNGMVSMMVSLVCIGLAWWALQSVKFDLWIRNPKGPQGRLLHLFLAVVLGRFVAVFLLDYISWSQMLRYMF